MQQQTEVMQLEQETNEKIAARAFAQSYLADLVPSVFGLLSDNGYFYDPVERGIKHIIRYNFFGFLSETPFERLRLVQWVARVLRCFPSRSEQWGPTN